jgi:hypothetical protein
MPKAKSIVIKSKKKEFPLYERLLAKVNLEAPLDSKVWPQINRLDMNNLEIIYYLILHHARLNGNKEEVPYAKKVHEGGRGVIYDVDSLPLELQHLLAECMKEITNS